MKKLENYLEEIVTDKNLTGSAARMMVWILLHTDEKNQTSITNIELAKIFGSEGPVISRWIQMLCDNGYIYKTQFVEKNRVRRMITVTQEFINGARISSEEQMMEDAYYQDQEEELRKNIENDPSYGYLPFNK